MSACRGCGEAFGQGWSGDPYHIACAPLICICADPLPDSLGECATCRRLVVTPALLERLAERAA